MRDETRRSRRVTKAGGGPAFSRLQVVPRSAQVRDRLTRAIQDGEYAVGDHLPSERELSELFGVSRVSVREAIRSLEAVGLVEVKHGAKTTVVDPADRAPRDLTRWMQTNRDEVLELLKVRGALDELAAHAAAEFCDPQRIEAIRAAHRAFAELPSATAPDELAEYDTAFHLAVGDAAGSELLNDLLRELHGHLVESRAVFFAPNRRAALSAKEHEAILSAIEEGDGAAARRATRKHVASVRAALEAG
jgi:GntR family transcriptional regulator, transcriptional repressor for pyruvate dehydrogenase complex